LVILSVGLSLLGASFKSIV